MASVNENPMPHLEFDKRLSLGNIITVGALLVTMATAWATLGESQRSQGRQLVNIDARVDAVESQASELSQRIADERVEQTRLLTELQADVRYMRAAIDDLGGPDRQASRD